ncbi:hypothetical protein EJ06DRAFT_499539 [Trichodelitschia bisporula]|uniref:MARVEL domain-containing protein n=1 Tax=Trichodelitschia bisporula TaxID=703511 RepID=A0A6G1HLR5_9PEZI|nr:hypothetical protein EJ06DRAFT_499539 [Trichodelitschia bisporula]
MTLRSKKTKVAPSSYPRLPFHALRTAQLLSALVVGGIMSFFIWHLTHDHWPTPWTFIVLMSVSLLTVAVLTTTIILHCCFGLNPRLNLAFNLTLFVLWALGFSLLSWWASGTLRDACAAPRWNDDVGVMVCRIYKALFAFTIVGFVSTSLAFLLDIYVFKRATRLGKYNAMHDPDNKPAAHTPVMMAPLNASHQGLAGYNAQQGVGRAHSGYAVPEEQFGYDTTYRGGAGQQMH